MSINGKKVLTLIPARAGSKRLPGKNLRMLSGKPLIAWSIEAAKKCPQVDRIIVSTDNPEIARIARRWGAETPFLRPAKLSTDHASSMSVVFHALDQLGKNNETYDSVVLLQPTSPLRTSEHLTAAVDLFVRKKASAVVSVSQAPHPPFWTNQLTPQGTLLNFFRVRAKRETEKKRPWYRLNGAIYIAKVAFLRKRKNWYSATSYAYIMPSFCSVDIDTKEDFLLADFLMKIQTGTPYHSWQ